MHRATVKILLVCVCVMAFCLAASAAAPTTGKFDIYFEITINSSLPADAPISCTLTTTVVGEPNLIEDSMSVAGTRVGNHATCTVPMYYSWALNNPGSDTVSLSYTVVDAASGLPYRQDSQSATMPVPTNGTASHIYVTVVL
jgi:hypothetical protein